MYIAKFSHKQGILQRLAVRELILLEVHIFENVKGLWLTQKHRKEYEKVKESFRSKGYILIDKLVNALDYGVPQDRKRVILFGIKFYLVDQNRKNALHKLKKILIGE